MDMEELKDLMAFMNENDLVELEVEQEGKKIRLVKKGNGAPEMVAVPVQMPATVVAGAATGAAAGAAEAMPEANIQIIKAPMVGTFYRSSSPDSDPFADVGTQVSQESVVCIIEAMKVMNEIHAEITGRIIEVLVENAHPVEYGQPLFKVQLEE